ncbi:hypothetical protein D1871_04075 [Nakamurella silvestris]|nr:hypothetical protein D1871_04075 [Nakamurella silvestris]
MTYESDPFADWDAAYVLGLLAPADRRDFERHLAGCPACTTAVAELAGMPGILGALSREEALALDPERPERPEHPEHQESARPRPPSLPVADPTSPARRNRARQLVLAAAVVLLLVGAGTVVGRWAIPTSVSATSAPAGIAVSMTPVRPGTMTADLRVITKAWGTRFEWTCQYLDTGWAADGPAPTYQLVVTDLAGTETPVATWSAAGKAAGGLVASTSVPTAQIRSVDIRTGNDPNPLVLAHL